MLRIITGGSAGRVTEELTGEMAARATASPNEKFIIIVPEQFTLHTQKTVVALHPGHACMNIDVVSFDRIAHVVLAKLGRDVSAILDDVGKSLILRNVLASCEDDLIVYRRKVRMKGFIDEVRSLITEFMQYRIDDNELFLMQEDAAERGGLLAAKLQDIRLIYRLFLEKIEDKYSTPEEVLDIFERCMPESDFISGCHIYLDGFTGFTPIQFRIIRQMLQSAADVTCGIAVPAASLRADAPEYDLFALACRTYYSLEETAREKGSAFEHIICAEDEPGPRPVHVVSCRNMQQETEYAASEILRLVREENVRFRDIAVLTTDMEGYYNCLRNVFSDAGIPCFIDYKEEFTENPLARFIMAALEISRKGMLYEPVFALLKTGIAGLDADECARLENYCLEFNIRGRSRWDSAFTANRTRQDGTEAWDLEQINELRKKAAGPISRFYGSTSSKSRPGSIYTKALRRLLEELEVPERILQMAEAFKAEGSMALALQYEQVTEKVTELIDKIELLIGGEMLDSREFASVMEGGLSGMKIGIIPPTLDTLVVGDITRTRLGSISHLFILGVNDGRIPSAGRSSVLFTQKERADIRKGHEIAPTIQENIYIQRYYLYLAFGRPTGSLTLTYAATSPEGEQMGPSCILEDMDELLPGVVIERQEAPDPAPAWNRAARRLLAGSMEKIAAGGSAGEDPVLAYFAIEEPEAIRSIALGACYSNLKTPLDGQVALDLYGEVLKGSVSRYETYYECPYRHFLNYGLRLEKRREYKVEATDLGTVYHDALEKYSRRIQEEGFTFRTVPDEDSDRVIKECVNDAVADMQSDVLTSSARNEYFMNRICEISGRTVNVLRDHVRSGLFEPEQFEYSFSESLDENVMFRGKIDRIDIYDSGDLFVKIIDYKSGNKKFSIRDIYSGVQLQLVAYMNSAVRAAKEDHKDRNVRPGGVYYYLINDRYTRNEDDQAVRNRMSGVTLAEEEVIHAVDLNLGKDGNMKSSIIPVSYSKSGLTSYSEVANADEFSRLIEFTNRRITEAGEKIRQGDITLAPYKDGSTHTGCSYCDYRDICRFEAGQFGTDWREAELDKNEMEREVYGRY